jgi:bifunctional non-homologous end joining protein LigD
MLWDRGTWAPIRGKSAKDLDKGHLHFILEGERMKGEWLLIRLRPRPGEKSGRENWLLRKISDAYAKPGDGLVERNLTSVLTKRSMDQIAADPEAEHSLKGKRGKDFDAVMSQAAKRNARLAGPVTRRGQTRKRPGNPPPFVKPQLATLVDAVPTGNGWMHEIKFDGYRALIAVAGPKVIVYTRNGLDWTDKFTPLAAALAKLDLPPALIDGEIIAYGPDNNPDFSSLQKVLKRGHGAQAAGDDLAFFAFDLLSLDGEDLKSLPNIERKERLEALLAAASPPIHLSEHVIGAGEKLYRAMCDAGQEGIVSKRIDTPYASRRSRAWVKVKCNLRQEFVVIGWKASTSKARRFASLLLAQHEGGKLVYKGNVGTGFTAEAQEELAGRMAKLETGAPAAAVPRAGRRGVTWLEPALVAEVAFAEFTAEGSVRHASFVGLREDKPAKAVKPERAVPAPDPPEEQAVKISNPDRVIYPADGLTKGDLAAYYRAIAPLMLPWAARRPISLVRCPQGRAKKCFFQKHDSGSFGEHVHHVPITEKNGAIEDYLYIENSAGLQTLVQMGTIELHGWGSRIDDVELPDRMVFDLDPDEGLDFADVRRAARLIHDRLADIGLTSFAMVSGGKGVHVVVPLTPGHSWEMHKDFSHRFAEALAMADSERFVATMSKAKRKGKIFIDYLRNQRGATAVLPYSARARDGAAVAAPIAWSELGELESGHPWSIRDADLLLERGAGRGLKGWGFAEQTLPDL